MRKSLLIAILFFVSSNLPAQMRIDSSSVSKPDTQVVPENAGWVSLQSNPESAEVYLDTIFIGKTPVVRYPLREGKRDVRLFYPGARIWGARTGTDTLEVKAGQETKSSIVLDGANGYALRRSDELNKETNPDLFLTIKEKGNSKLWMVYAAGATMILSGVLSAYLKNESDKDFDFYLSTNDPGHFASTQRLDRLSGVSLFVAELSLGTLMYLLLSE